MISDSAPSLIALQEGPPGIEGVLAGLGYNVSRESGLVTGSLSSQWRPHPPPFLAYHRGLGIVLTSLSGAFDLLVCNVHLQSRLRATDMVSSRELRSIMREVNDLRQRGAGAESELILGDFNLDPYDTFVLERDGLNSNRSLGYVRRNAPTVVARDRPLYNIGWRLLERHDDPVGTCYFTSQEPDQPWHVFDHASVTPDLAAGGPPEAELVVEISGLDLRARDTRGPNKMVGSDHFPVRWTLKPLSFF